MARAAFMAMVVVLATLGVGRPARATRWEIPERVCFPLRGTIRVTMTATDCASPVGLCTEGVFRSSFISGRTRFMATGLGGEPVGEASIVTPGAEPATTWSYSGVLTIETRLGTLVLSDVGVLDTVAGIFTELNRPVAGTGTFAGVSGRVYMSGTVVDDGTGFDGDVSGELCVPTR